MSAVVLPSRKARMLDRNAESERHGHQLMLCGRTESR